MSISELYRSLNPTSIRPDGVEGVRPSQIQDRVSAKTKNPSEPSEFEQILRHENKSFSLSQHAETRIKSREIPWDSHLEKRISKGIDQAESKGSREALILADDVAVIANVKSRTVVTAMERSQMKEKVFTNIDSAVLV
ncbi:MAG: flagellar biosynthesis protein [Deltaproteobacteria bacterium]|nr:flagellar biosynthesis protein [Deltaproteobacteria bacterium]